MLDTAHRNGKMVIMSKKKKSLFHSEEIKTVTQIRKENVIPMILRINLMEELPETIFFQNQKDKIDIPIFLFQKKYKKCLGCFVLESHRIIHLSRLEKTS